MAFSVAPLLIYSDGVPGSARQALLAASQLPPERRNGELEAAARALYAETDLDCGEVRELVGLPPRPSSSCF